MGLGQREWSSMAGKRAYSVGALVAAVFLSAAAGGAQTVDTLLFDQRLNLALAGDEDAQVAVGRAYETGGVIDVSKVEAAKWYRKAADQGSAEAMFRLARIVSGGAEGIKKNLDLAAKLYE